MNTSILALRDVHPHIKPHNIVWARHDAVSVIGECMSYPDPESGDAFVRLVPGMASTAVMVPLDKIQPVDDAQLLKMRRCANGYSFAVAFAKVSGRGEFPVDMLRYDSCVPFNFSVEWDDEAERPTIIREGDGVDGLIVAKVSFRPWSMNALADYTPARWESFNWSIVNYGKKDFA